jgi:hypothetical protein
VRKFELGGSNEFEGNIDIEGHGKLRFKMKGPLKGGFVLKEKG